MVCQLVMVCQLFMMLMNNHEAALMPPSQSHAKPNEEGMLGTFVTIAWTAKTHIFHNIVSYPECAVPVLQSITPCANINTHSSEVMPIVINCSRVQA